MNSSARVAFACPKCAAACVTDQIHRATGNALSRHRGPALVLPEGWLSDPCLRAAYDEAALDEHLTGAVAGFDEPDAHLSGPCMDLLCQHGLEDQVVEVLKSWIGAADTDLEGRRREQLRAFDHARGQFAHTEIELARRTAIGGLGVDVAEVGGRRGRRASNAPDAGQAKPFQDVPDGFSRE